jgi:uncharacterized membrane protein YhaH (DUF805 family)
MEPINWFMNVVTEHYFDFNGRARRAEFWWYMLVYFIIAVVLGVVQSILGIGSVLTGLLAIALLLPNLGVGVRRLHDTNRSGWWILIGIIPIVGWILLIYWYVQPGTSGANEFGADPKAGLAAAAA